VEEAAPDRVGGSRTPGQGLIGMRERAALVGGHAVARSRAGGWTVRAVLPMNHDGRTKTDPRAARARSAPEDRTGVQERP
jgi:signal transduction histidine kinase